MPDYEIRLLSNIQEMRAIEDLIIEIWQGGDRDTVPYHILITFVHNGGIALGAFENDEMIGFAFGFPGFIETPQGLIPKHCSHQMGVHPAHRGRDIGFALKRAQLQMVRQQGLDLISWTYDPLLSQNAYLNIARLGAVCNTYKRNEYGDMVDELNAGGITSDRFQVDWWLNTKRVERHLDPDERVPLGLANYQKAAAQVLYIPEADADLGVLRVPDHYARPEKKLLLMQIPSDYQRLRAEHVALARDWRNFTREAFETAFDAGYIVTDFIYDRSEKRPRSFYVLTDGESTIG